VEEEEEDDDDEEVDVDVLGGCTRGSGSALAASAAALPAEYLCSAPGVAEASPPNEANVPLPAWPGMWCQ